MTIALLLPTTIIGLTWSCPERKRRYKQDYCLSPGINLGLDPFRMVMNILALGIGNLGGPDLVIILLIVLVLFGAKRLPDLARGLGQSMNEFRKAREDIGWELHNEGVQPSQPRPCQVHAAGRSGTEPQQVTPAAQAIPSLPPRHSVGCN
jgi:sec-independent protein translocase protein TatA